MFELTMLKASEGDCLLLSYGREAKTSYVLIDGGKGVDYPRLRNRLAKLAEGNARLELLVVTHIDADHIDGIVRLFRDPQQPIQIDEVWFNGFAQMDKLESMGFRAGDELSDLLKQRSVAINERFGGGPVMSGAGGPITLAGGLRIELLSPERAKLTVLRERWESWRTAEAAAAAQEALDEQEAQTLAQAQKAGLEMYGKRAMPAKLDIDALADSASSIDQEPPNGSSIAMLATFDGRTVLLGADAHPDTLVRQIKAGLPALGARLPVHLLKVPHHGSRKNTTRELVELLDCSRFAVSTTGAHFGHPDPEAIARLIKYASSRPTMYFNSRHEQTEPWERLGDRVTCVFPQGRDEEIRIQV